MIKIGLIGYGYWGPNLARNFNNNPDLDLTAICEFSSDRREAAGRLYPRVELLDSEDDLFKRSELDAIAISTPVSTHYDLAKRALVSGRHVWLEKPMTETVEQAEELIELAEKNKKTIMVDHTFIYTGAVQKIKGLVVESGPQDNRGLIDLWRQVPARRTSGGAPPLEPRDNLYRGRIR